MVKIFFRSVECNDSSDYGNEFIRWKKKKITSCCVIFFIAKVSQSVIMIKAKGWKIYVACSLG